MSAQTELDSKLVDINIKKLMEFGIIDDKKSDLKKSEPKKKIPRLELIQVLFCLKEDINEIINFIKENNSKNFILNLIEKDPLISFLKKLSSLSIQISNTVLKHDNSNRYTHFLEEAMMKFTNFVKREIKNPDLMSHLDIVHKKKFIIELNKIEKIDLNNFIQILNLFRDQNIIIQHDLTKDYDGFLQTHIKGSSTFPNFKKQNKQYFYFKSDMGSTFKMRTFFFKEIQLRLNYYPFIVFDNTKGFVLKLEHHAYNVNTTKSIIRDLSYKTTIEEKIRFDGKNKIASKTISDAVLQHVLKIFFVQETLWFEMYKFRLLTSKPKSYFFLPLIDLSSHGIFIYNSKRKKVPFGLRIDLESVEAINLSKNKNTKKTDNFQIRYPVIGHITPYIRDK